MKRTALILSAALLVSACGETKTDKVEAPTTPETKAVATGTMMNLNIVSTDDGAYALDWAREGDLVGFTVEVTSNPEATNGTVIAEDINEANFTWTPNEEIDERQYFIVKAPNGQSLKAATRLLPLEDGRNFRDLGGYATEDGQTVKWGKLFRSGVMDGLTEADYDYLSSLDIKVVCDLRTSFEREEEPTDWKAGEAEYLYFPDPVQDPATSFGAVFRDPELTAEKVANAFGDAYFEIAHEQAPAYTAMFDKLAAGEAPLAFNCSAGKDRTGVGAALILSVLGVPRETIVEDYALSDDYVDYMSEFLNEDARKKAEEEGSPYAFLFQLPPEVVSPMMESRPEYIEKFFSDIEAEYGSVETFLKEKVAVTNEEIAAIRANYLQ